MVTQEPGGPSRYQGITAAAYTTNEDNDIIPDGFPAINFRPKFSSKMDPYSIVINKWKNSKIDTNRLDSQRHQRQGTSLGPVNANFSGLCSNPS